MLHFFPEGETQYLVTLAESNPIRIFLIGLMLKGQENGH